jgi:PKD repeat protein
VRPGILHAYNAQNVTSELWNSQQVSARDSVGNYAKFCPPTVANGKVYLATFSSRLNVYGLLPSTAPPQLALSPPRLNFGPLVIGRTSTQSFQLVNTGGPNLNGSAATALPFAIQSGSPFSLTPGQTGLVAVSFSPTNAASFSNQVVFTSNGGNSSNSVTGAGLTPAQLAVAPTGLDFGTVAVGASAQASFVVTNLGGAALTNGLATVSPGPFAIVSGTPFALPGFGGTNLVVRFAPTNAGNFTNKLVFTTGNGGNSTNTLTGTGALGPTANFTGSPTTGLKPLSVTFTDNSTGTITNRFWDFGDGATLNTAASGVMHTYTQAGTNTVSLTVSGPAGANTLTRPNYILVTNLPPQLSLSPPSLNFGPLIIGQSTTQSFQLVNTGGPNLNGSAATTLPFAIQGGSPFSLTPGQTGLVAVSFSPTNAASFSNLVVFTSNGGNSSNSVTGTGLTPAQLAVAPTRLDFGTVAVGASAQASFVVTNIGGAALTNGVATVSGGPYTIVSGTPFALPGFGGTNLVVRFAPTNAANFTNKLIFTTANGGNSTNTLTGAGALAPTANFTGSPTIGAWPLTVSFTDNSTGTITNGFWDFGDGANTNTATAGVMHTYQGAGTNTVSLTVSGPVGANTLTRPNYIVVTNLPPVIITILISSNQVQLTWLSGTLQSASQVTGPYTNVTIATSPYSVPPSDATRFFRVKVR